MKTTIGKAVEAYKALTRLLLQELPIKQGIALSRLRAALKTDYDFACMEERKAMEKYGAEEKNGRVIFHKPETRPDYFRRVNEVLAAEVEIETEPVDISALENVRISLGALEGFVTYG